MGHRYGMGRKGGVLRWSLEVGKGGRREAVGNRKNI